MVGARMALLAAVVVAADVAVSSAQHALLGGMMRESRAARLSTAGAAWKRKIDGLGPISEREFKCRKGKAGGIFPCKKVDMLSLLRRTEMGAAQNADGSDMWGWTDPETDGEYALATFEDGMAVVDISQANAPQPLLFVPSQSRIKSYWRDVKVYRDVAYVVADVHGKDIGVAIHSMQMVDLTRVRGAARELVTAAPDALYDGVQYTHNIVINQESGFAYLVGSNTCSGGLHVLDLRADPLAPSFVGCYRNNGYVHDAECVIYRGPDVRFTGREVCFLFQSDSHNVRILDITDKRVDESGNLVYGQVLADTVYPNSALVHQGWLTDDMRFLLVGDEEDELFKARKAKSFVFDVQDLRSPVYVGSYESAEIAVDHNLYVRGDDAFMTNYMAGLRVNDLSRLRDGKGLKERAYFDTTPGSESVGDYTTGAWSSYVFFPSGVVAVNTIENGLFILRVRPGANKCKNVGGLVQEDGTSISCRHAYDRCASSALVQTRCAKTCNVCKTEKFRLGKSCSDLSPHSGLASREAPTVPLACADLASRCDLAAVRLACPVTCNTCGDSQANLRVEMGGTVLAGGLGLLPLELAS